MTTKLLALAASTRTDSLNKKLLTIASAHATAVGASVTTLDYASCDAPLYREESIGAPLPPGAALLADALLSHDGLLLASPEYNWSIPGELKNLIDWLSVDPRAPLRGKTALLMCATPSSRGGVIGLQQLRVPLEHLGVFTYPHVVGVGNADKHLAYDAPADDSLVHEKTITYLNQCVTDFVRVTNQVMGKA